LEKPKTPVLSIGHYFGALVLQRECQKITDIFYPVYFMLLLSFIPLLMFICACVDYYFFSLDVVASIYGLCLIIN